MGILGITAAATVVLAAILLVLLAPRAAISRAQDRLAERLLAAGGDPPALLTRAEHVAGRWRRIPGVLGLSAESLFFEGLFGEIWSLALPRIQQVATGRRMLSGRLLFRMEVIRITAADGSQTEFVLTEASLGAWRSHLGLWAMGEQIREAGSSGGSPENVVPGR